MVLCSYHHHNTEKVANVFARVLGAQVKTPRQVNPEELTVFDLVGFGSGIYSSNVHGDLMVFAEKLPEKAGGKALIFSTSGAPSFFDRHDDTYREKYMHECHMQLRKKLQAKGYSILGEFSCPGFNTNSFLKVFGGINKGRPDVQDLKKAEELQGGSSRSC